MHSYIIHKTLLCDFYALPKKLHDYSKILFIKLISLGLGFGFVKENTSIGVKRMN